MTGESVKTLVLLGMDRYMLHCVTALESSRLGREGYGLNMVRGHPLKVHGLEAWSLVGVHI